MPNVYDGSRSPVRAINAATQPSWTPSVASPPRSWSEPSVQEVRPAPPEPAATALALDCPDCGAGLRLALVAGDTRGHLAHPHPHPELRAAPATEGLPDFEESVRSHKRDLMLRALEDNGGVMTRAAKALGLKYTTFVAMAHRLDVVAPDCEEQSGG